MITAVFTRDSGLLTGFTVSGHAGFSAHGRDIVCAAVSAAVEMCCNAVTELAKLPAEVTQEDGTIGLRLRSPDPTGDLLLRALQLELDRISAQYPRNLKTVILP